MERSDLNVEYSHFYLIEGIGAEQFRSIQVTEELLASEKSNITLTVLIDDRPENFKGIPTELIKRTLSLKSRSPDWLIRESGLSSAADKLVEALPDELINYKNTTQIKRSIDLKLGKERIRLWKEYSGVREYTCATLTATWLLCRLGELQLPSKASLVSGTTQFEAKETVTILHERYRILEAKAHRIIEMTKYAGALSRIQYHYFQ